VTLNPSAATRLVALLGDPVSHSLSPRFQNAGFRAAGVDGVYLALRCSSRDLPGLLAGISRAGGGGNATLPHKADAAELVERRTEAVVRTGACNTFWAEDGVVCGDNTDVIGAGRAVVDLLGTSAAGSRVLLLGGGGAARAALYALLDQGADQVLLLNRTPARAEAALSGLPEFRARIGLATSLSGLESERFDLIVNATSLGLRPGDPLPLELPAVGEVGAALDLVYRPEPTEWIRYLRANGVRADDGLGMLVHQGAAAFERWWGIPAPFAAMRASIRRADSDDEAALAPEAR
jgi:shikimate dehydrogenase